VQTDRIRIGYSIYHIRICFLLSNTDIGYENLISVSAYIGHESELENWIWIQMYMGKGLWAYPFAIVSGKCVIGWITFCRSLEP